MMYIIRLKLLNKSHEGLARIYQQTRFTVSRNHFLIHPQVFNGRLKTMVVIVKSVSDIIMMHIYLFFDTYCSTEGDKLTHMYYGLWSLVSFSARSSLSRVIFIHIRATINLYTYNRSLDIYMPSYFFT